MKNILVPIDGSEAALRALDQAINMAQQQKNPCTLHVLNVQPPIVSNNAARFFTPEVLKDYYNDAGKEALNNAKKRLANLDVPHEVHVEVGTVIDVITEHVTSCNCDHIVMGTRGLGAVPGLLLGSVATKVLNAVTVPVTLVK